MAVATPFSLKKLLHLATEKCNCLRRRPAPSDHETHPTVLHRVLERCRVSMDFRTATKIHARVVVLGFSTYPSIVASLISIYAQCHQPHIALHVFSRVLDLFSMNLVFGKMSVRDVVTWNSMVGGYVKNSRFFDALSIFRRMLSDKVEPDGFTFALVVTACARLGARQCQMGAWFSGLAIHGLAMNANVVFSRMQMESVLPDSITFIGILTACSHCGFVEEGHKYFGMMQNRFMIQPQLKHYGTVVDLLGRAGLMEDVIWRALLSACRIHRKKELGEVAIANISRLESGDLVRQMMKTGGVRKSRGKSWVELGDGIHQFNAAYQSHAQMKSIYRVLEEIIVRDRIRFHQFEGGVCSCRDYW
uniref:DYW domain-containing protein n=2 Tax=Glycine subgen. Soja TaxID=1462606 RepID=K7MBF3_SOYBN